MSAKQSRKHLREPSSAFKLCEPIKLRSFVDYLVPLTDQKLHFVGDGPFGRTRRLGGEAMGDIPSLPSMLGAFPRREDASSERN